MPFGIMSKHDSRVTAKYSLKEVLGKWVTSHNCVHVYSWVWMLYYIIVLIWCVALKLLYICVYTYLILASTCWEPVWCSPQFPVACIISKFFVLFTMVCACRGAFSEVYRAVQKDTHKEFAIKVIKKDALKGKEEALQMEVQVLQKLVMYSFSSSHIMSTSSFKSAVLRHTFYKHSCSM